MRSVLLQATRRTAMTKASRPSSRARRQSALRRPLPASLSSPRLCWPLKLPTRKLPIARARPQPPPLMRTRGRRRQRMLSAGRRGGPQTLSHRSTRSRTLASFLSTTAGAAEASSKALQRSGQAATMLRARQAHSHATARRPAQRGAAAADARAAAAVPAATTACRVTSGAQAAHRQAAPKTRCGRGQTGRCDGSGRMRCGAASAVPPRLRHTRALSLRHDSQLWSGARQVPHLVARRAGSARRRLVQCDLHSGESSSQEGHSNSTITGCRRMRTRREAPAEL